MAFALFNPLTNQVQTFIREDHGGYRPPEGWELRTAEELPEGWTMAPEDTSEADAEHNARLEAAEKIIDEPQTPQELATWAAIQEVVNELRAAKVGKPKPSRTDAELREAAKARLKALRR